MASEPLDPILIQVTIPLPLGMIFGGLTEPPQLARWLCAGATVESKVGGRFDLEFQEPEAFTSHGKVTHFQPAVDVGFTWEAPERFAPLMNQPGRPTTIYIRLQESPEGIDVTLEHDGWGAEDLWGDARSWHFRLWDDRLHRFKDYILKAAYG
jgi:uncharacterized protein YndB with AHSA1/START domain